MLSGNWRHERPRSHRGLSSSRDTLVRTSRSDRSRRASLHENRSCHMVRRLQRQISRWRDWPLEDPFLSENEMNEPKFPPRKPWEPSRMRMGGAVTVEDLLSICAARTNAPSSLGTQLERMRNRETGYDGNSQALKLDTHGGCQPTKVPVFDPRMVDQLENEMVQNAPALTCLAELASVRNTPTLKTRSALVSMAKHTPGRGQGELVVQCLRAYEVWRSISQERALAAVFAWSRRLCGQPVKDENVLAQEFREGKSPAARRKASELYADALLVAQRWVVFWNNRLSKQKAYYT